MVKHYMPTSLNEALTILNQDDCYIMAGGTDLMVQKHTISQVLPSFNKSILFLNHVDELKYVKVDEDGVHIGSGMVINDLENDVRIPKIIRDVLKELASPQIRNIATMAGNVCNASPAGDSIVPLYVLNAKIILVSCKGERRVNINDFIVGVRKTTRLNNELVKEILIPNNSFDKTYWKKVGSRKAETISKVSMAGAYQLIDGRLVDLSIAFGSVGITIIRNKEIEDKFIGRMVKDIDINDIVDEYSLIVRPIDDQRSTAKYRHIVAMNILKDFLKKLKAGERDR